MLENCEIKIFAAVVKNSKILLKNFSGNWELVGERIETEDFTDYSWSAMWHSLKRSLAGEGDLELISLSLPILMLPHWSLKDGIADLYFTVVIPWKLIGRTINFDNKLSKHELKFFSEAETEKLNIVSDRMKYMIEQAFSVISSEDFLRRLP